MKLEQKKGRADMPKHNNSSPQGSSSDEDKQIELNQVGYANVGDQNLKQTLSITEGVFSFFKKPITTIIPNATVTLTNVYELVRSDDYLAATLALRSLSKIIPKGCKESPYTTYKAASFDYVTFNGVFSMRRENSIVNLSGYFTIDIDHIASANFVLLFERLKSDSVLAIQLMFVSPGGDGLKIVVGIDPTLVDLTKRTKMLDNYWSAFNGYFSQNYSDLIIPNDKIEFIDGACKDLSRACFLNCDRNAYLKINGVRHGEEFIKRWTLRAQTVNAGIKKKKKKSLSLSQLHEQHLLEINNHTPELLAFVGAAIAVGTSKATTIKYIVDNVHISAQSSKNSAEAVKKLVDDLYERYGRQSDRNQSHFEIFSNVFQKLGIVRNEITRKLELADEVLTEQRLNSIFIDVIENNRGVKGLNKQNFETYINSDKIPKFNAIVEYLNSLKVIDSSSLIVDLAKSLNIKTREYFNNQSHRIFNELKNKTPRYYNNPCSDFVIGMIKKWIVGIVAGLFGENYNCIMLVLIGPKNTGKTEFFRRLLPERLKKYFAQSKLDQGKDSEALLCEKLLILNDELNLMNKKDASEFRRIISQCYATYRPPYGRQNETHKRYASIAGTSNDPDIINDPVNNRRIIPIEITGINFDKYNAIDKDHLFSEVYQLYLTGYKWELDDLDIQYLDEFTKGYETTSVERDLITKLFKPGLPDEFESHQYTTGEITEILSKTYPWLRFDYKRVGKELKALGFRHRSKRGHNGNRYPTKVYDCIVLSEMQEWSAL